MDIPNANCGPFLGKTERDLLAGILLASGGTPASVPNTAACPEWGYGKHTVRDILGGILLAIQNGGGGGVDLSSPPPIGDVAPNTGEFTDLVAATFQGVIGNVTPAAGTFTGVVVNQTLINAAVASGLSLVNTTAATDSQNQSSPSLILRSQGWKTTATAASQPVEWAIVNEPLTGGNNPVAQLQFKARINDGTWVDVVTFTRNAANPFGQQAFFGGSATVQSNFQVGGALSINAGQISSVAQNAHIRSPGAATWQLGQDSATIPTAQTLKAHDVTTGTGADLLLSGGTGSVANGMVRIGTHSAIGAETVTGYIEIKDAGGTVRKLAVVS